MTGSSQGSTTGTTLPTYKPNVPTMGGLQQTGSTEYVPWVGGKPNTGWTGLEDQPDIIHPTMLRPTTAGSSQKSQAYRTMGLSDKFGHSGDLLDFQSEVLKHFEKYGLDTITYVCDPANPTKMASIVDQHTKFSKEDASKAVQLVIKDYDEYDKANIADAKTFVENSLTKELAKELGMSTKKGIDNFVDFWMLLMEIIRVPSTDHFEEIKKTLRERKISDFAGENVVKMAQAITNDYDQLINGGLYDQQLTLNALDAIMEGGGPDNEDFRGKLRILRQSLDDKLLKIRYLSPELQQEAMVKDKLDMISVLEQCKAQYRLVHGKNKWPAATSVTDSKTLPRDYGKANMAEAKTFAAMVNAIVRKELNAEKKKGLNGRGDKNAKRNNVGKPAKGKKEWENPKKAKGKQRGKRGGNGPPPPKPGEPEIKFFDDVKKYWCAKCNRWTLSHGTDGHKTKEELEAEREGKPSINRVAIDHHPAIFKAQAKKDKRWCGHHKVWQSFHGTNQCEGSAAKPRFSSNANDWIRDDDKATETPLDSTTWWKTLLIAMWLALLLNLANAVASSPAAMAVASSVWHDLSQFVSLVMREVTANAPVVAYSLWRFAAQHWLIYSQAAVAAAIGFGTLFHVTPPKDGTNEEKKPKHHRNRKGAGYLKQLRRRAKLLRGHGTKRGTKIRRLGKRDMVDDAYARSAHHPKYAHISRPKRMEPPLYERIRMVESAIQETEEEIRRLE